MPIVTLIAKPGGLSHVVVETICRQWRGTGLVWLAPEEAAQFALRKSPPDAPEVWQTLQHDGIDLLIHPLAGQRKRLFIADMDSTMIEQECIDELADAVGVGAQVSQITARAMNGELDFEAAIDMRVGLLQGLDTAVIQSVLQERITLASGAAVLLATMRKQGALCVLVSGGFTAFTEAVAEWLGFHAHYANELLQTANGTLTGAVAKPVLGREAKLERLKAILAERGWSRQDAIAVGDGMNDLSMLEAAGLGVALHGKSALQAAIDLRVNHADLTALLYLQGYRKQEFVFPTL